MGVITKAVVLLGLFDVVWRRLRRIAHSDYGTGHVERQIVDVGLGRDLSRQLGEEDRDEGCRHGGFHRFGNQNGEATGIAVAPESGSGSVLVFATEAEAVGAFLPTDSVGELVTAQVTALSSVCRVANGDVRTAQGHLRPVQADTTRAIRGVREQVAIVPVLIAEPEVIDDCGFDAAGPAKQRLVRPIGVPQPVGLGLRTAVGSNARVAVVGVAGEQLVLRVHRVVEARAQLSAFIRTREGSLEDGNRGEIGRHAEGLGLGELFKVEEEEELFLLDRAAEPEPGITADKERIGVQRVAAQAGIGGHVVVAEIVIGGAMVIVGSRAGDCVHRADAGDASRQVIVDARYLEFLDDFLREIHASVAFNRVADVSAVNGD